MSRIDALIRHAVVRQLFNAGLRLLSLATKLLLTLYMGRYLGLSELGTYGLVAAYVAIAIPLMGLRLDYVVSREIIDLPPEKLAIKLRDQGVFFLLNYMLFIVMAGALAIVYPGLIDLRLLVLVVVLSITESMSAVSTGMLVPLKQPILSTCLFFIRSAAWVFPVILLGLLDPAWRTANAVLYCWLIGVIISISILMVLWRKLPWGQAFKTPVDWVWMRKSIRVCLPVWLGTVGAAAAINLDRFVVEFSLGRDFVGITSFYGSFVVAMTALLQNGVIAFSYPKLVSFHKKGDDSGFVAESRRMIWQSTLASGAMSVMVGLIVPWMGELLGRSEFADHAAVLWLMLVGAWLRSSVESHYFILYARHHDRPIWLGNLLLLAASFTATWGMVQMFGFIGVGYGAILSGLFIAVWRIFWVFHYKCLKP